MTKNKKIAIVGGGVMGSVLVRTIIGAKIAKSIIVCEKDKKKERLLKKISKSVKVTSRLEDCRGADLVFLAVKPQDFSGISLDSGNSMIVSVMAGVPISKIKKQLKTDLVVRTMPNMAARFGEAFTVWTATKQVSAADKALVRKILTGMGEELFVAREDVIDKATAVSGSGPGYFFHVIDVFIQAAKKLGFGEKEATKMVLQTFKGASIFIDEKSDVNELVKNVASKGGTTEAALKVFFKKKFGKIWEEAVKAAYKRAKELSK